ncbi:hypothetical protein SPRG_08053 [Saprolegnia parasitica CBS 223.65]|uniref:G domain-containing protein n=1 Tax=Saprolegnia parasitica (strain CBS 223.65) TaxID=695850 RepID=A0A067C7B3_SAPPC|nr:hypothetical protein SPRG_08053 [Saprolegnia parasitica CBS 223.65]KDO26649.1 hypothetical protein SPRG_08053 [Saprolegnia parasitica CBS 223.65]|eukprot:XP_012202786.1 hypothetical protein SPRG_08053 [Saprolegnia parasitica CBS 223.65]
MLRRLSRAIPTRPWTSLPLTASRQFNHAPKLTALPRALEHFTHGHAFCTAATGSVETSAHARKLLAHIDLMEELTCSGCGIEMQFKDEAKVGYCSTAALEKIEDVQEIATKLICQRCFQIRNYGKITDTKMAYDEYEKRVKALKPRDMLMIQLVDILDITGSLLGNARHVVGKKPVLLVVNKADMIPTHSGARRLMRRIKMAAEDLGIENVIGIRLVSSTKSLGIKEIIGDIKKHRENRDVCVIGAANAGKSTFLNALISHVSKSKKFGGKATQRRELEDISLDDFEEKAPEQLVFNEDEIDADEEVLSLKQKKQLSKGAPSKHMTTSALPGTTLAVSPIPVVIGQKPCNVLDTPGLIVDKKRQRLVEILSQPGCMELTNAIPGNKLPTTIYKVAPGRSLFLGAMLRMDYENALSTKGKNELLFTWYGVLPGHLSKTEHADDTFMKHAGGLLSPPRGLDAISLTGPLLPHNSSVKLSDFITTDVKTKSKLAKRPKRTTLVELVVPGFGWLAVTGVDLDGTLALEQTLKKASIKFSTVDGIQVHPRVPLFPYEMSSSNKHEWKQ